MILVLALIGCRNKDYEVVDSGLLIEETGPVDADGDGFPASEDCDDEDPAVRPDAVEVCNGIDDDCNDLVDDNVLEAWYTDADEDGYGDPATEAEACEGEGGQVADATDCDDTDPAVNPGAEEICNDLDDDCDGEVDEEVLISVWIDADGDGFGEPGTESEACEVGSGEAAMGEDCDDTRADVNPGTVEVCDEADNDCDGDTDEGVLSTFYADADEDGYGDRDTSTEACDVPTGFVEDDTDCDDTREQVNPGADEICNDLDDDCDGDTDEDSALDAGTWYTDGDGDGYGAGAGTVSCDQPSGTSALDTDCDDADGDVNPGATEVCNDVDDDCDGDTDGGAVDADTWYEDGDEDGYGDPSSSTTECDQPSGYVSDATDCDDNDDDTHPGADEECNDEDDDCDGTIDEDDAIDADTWYADSDGDGYGDPSSSLASCEQPSGYVDDTDDCDDADAAVNPDAEEVCDGVDNDCDGDTDPGFTDSDGDGTPNCVDSTVWSYDFSTGSLSDWTIVDLGGSNSPNWNLSGSYAYEASNAAYTVLIGPDLGELDTWTFSADVYMGGAATDYLGLVFDYQDSSNFWVARVNDPTGYYSRFSPTGRVELVECVSGSCSLVDYDDSEDYTIAYGSSVSMSVGFDGTDILVEWDGAEVLSYTPSSAPEPGSIGFYSYDNDGGSYYGDPEVTNP